MKETKNRKAINGNVIESKAQKPSEGTLFDDVLRTIQERYPRLLVPLINEIFHTDYPKDTPVTRLAEGYQKIVSKVVADSCSVSGSHVYHLECQSTRDGAMMLRMVEYDFWIGLSGARKENGEYVLRFPRSCIIYLRGEGNKLSKESMKIEFQDGVFVKFRVPTVHVKEYGLDEIFEKGLLIYLPYYVMRYEKSLEQIEKDEERKHAMKKEYERIMECLSLELADDPVLLQDMIRLMRRVWDYVLRRNDELKEEVGRVMGGRVLDLPSDKLREEFARGVNEGISRGISQGLSQGEYLTLISLVQRKIKKGKNLKEIAEDLDMDAGELQFFYDQICVMGVDCEPGEILKKNH